MDEDLITRWREQNRDDAANHDYSPASMVGSDQVFCLVCSDDAAGLLHAFDPSFPEGYFDEAIFEAQCEVEGSA